MSTRSLALCAALVTACDAPGPQPEESCPAGSAQAIFGGRAVHADAPGVRAVGAIESDQGTLYCTGTVIHPHWLLTAAHCVPGGDLRLRLSSTDGTAFTVPLGPVLRHPQADLALIPVTMPDVLVSAQIRPLAFRRSPLDASLVGTSAVLAGVGLTEDDGRGELRWAEEPITAVDEAFITVDGQGLTGACLGDSGGPLLDVARNAAEVLGVLSDGSGSCRGKDRYVRLDVHARWLEEQLASPVPQEVSCAPQR